MMKKTIELTRYQLQIYFKGSKFVMPFIMTMTFLFIMYSIKPTGIIDSFSITCYLIFLIMVWIGLSISSSEDPVMEQILILRIQSNFYYYLSKVFVLIVIGLLETVLCLAFPIIQNIIHHNEFFIRQLTGHDIVNAFILFIGCSFVGGTLGSLLHARVMKERKQAIVFTALLAVLTIIRTAILQEVPAFQIAAWIIPPVDNISNIYGKANVFHLGQTCMIFMSLLLYGILYSIIKSYICSRRKF